MDKCKCRICGCTDDDCRQCIEKTGRPCYWIEDDLCSACLKTAYPKSRSCCICPFIYYPVDCKKCYARMKIDKNQIYKMVYTRFSILELEENNLLLKTYKNGKTHN